MAITDIANVVISLQSAGVSRAGFGTPLFATAHKSFPERVRAYTSVNAVAEDFDTSSNAYKAAQAVFSNTPAVRQFKIGRIDADSVLSFNNVTEGTVFQVSVTSGEVSVQAEYTALLADTATEVATAIQAALDVAPLNTVVSATVVGSTVVLASVGEDAFTVSDLQNVSQAFTVTETPAEILTVLSEEDNDFYVITAEDHSASFVTAMAGAVEAVEKIYFFSSSEQSSLAAITDPINVADALALVQATGYFRTVGMYAHNDADFPELTYAGYNLPFTAGSVTWTNLQVAIPFALDGAGKKLSTTQQNNIAARNGSFVRREGGLNILRGGLVAGGEKIENIRGRDNLQVDMKADFTNLLINQQGTKLPYNNLGLNTVRSVMKRVLDAYVTRNFINPNYVVTIPDVSQISAADKQAGLLKDATFRAELTGAITLIDITGTLAIEL